MYFAPNTPPHSRPKKSPQQNPTSRSVLGPILHQPTTSKDTSSCQDSNFYVGSSCMQGWRSTMEDCHTHILSLPDDPDASYFGVFDGHGGMSIARYAGYHLHKIITKSAAYRRGKIAHSMRQAYLRLDDTMFQIDEIKEEQSGSTGITILIRDGVLYCANVGDSRAVGCVCGKAEALSFDHKPYVEKERMRITAAGGWIESNRVNGNLALSRALGDFGFKRNQNLSPEQQIVTAFPEIEIKEITPDWEFLVMGCDGIWDVVTSQDCVDYIRRHIAIGDEPEDICEAIMMHCLAPEIHSAGIGCDNMTIMIIGFLHGGTYEELMVKCARTPEIPSGIAQKISPKNVRPTEDIQQNTTTVREDGIEEENVEIDMSEVEAEREVILETAKSDDGTDNENN